MNTNMYISIHTVNAREDILLKKMHDYFEVTPKDMFRITQGILNIAVNIFEEKGIKYKALKSALVPSTDRFEAGFIFDTRDIESSWYRLEVMNQLLPLLDIKSNYSVQCGDLIGENQEFIFSILRESLVISRQLNFEHGSALYCVYINNLTESRLHCINESLSNFNAYVGYISCKFSSRARTYLSRIVSNSFLKHGRKLIMGHEDDRPNEENINTEGYPFEEYRMNVYSPQSMYFGVLLSYKIERPVFKDFESGTELSLNGISSKILPIEGFSVEINEKKHEYLQSNKSNKLKKAGIEAFSKDELADLICSKTSASYI